MGRFANIIVDISHEKVDRPFQYKIPESLQNVLQVGMAVWIPFGMGNKKIKGFCMEITDIPSYEESKLKEIIGLVEHGVTAGEESIALAAWMKQQYGSTMNQALKTVLPVKKQAKQVVKKTVICLVDSVTAQEKSEYFESKHQKAKARLMHELSIYPSLPYSMITGKLNITGKTLTTLAEDGLLKIEEEKSFREVYANHRDEAWEEYKPKALSCEQQSIVDDFLSAYKHDIRQTCLIHGITGSGKTEVYMELIAYMQSIHKQSIVLIPEIALTYQTLMRFYQRFGNRVSVMNSKLSPAERADQFARAENGEVDIMIGPRSALFTPFKNLGLIIIDEEHEGSYKSETMPKYHAREVAQKICSMKHASLVLGSATPSMEAYYRAKEGEYKLYEMKNRHAGGELATVHTIDLREELKSGNRSIFSRKLRELIQDRLDKGQQSMLFINRRGYAGFVSCRACGHVMTCPHCDVSLSEHQNGKLVCHYCGYETAKVQTCPECGSKYILGFRAGTQQIEDALKKEFPTARILRMDADTTKSKEGYETILSAFANEEADILVGTQMIVKGHDFPKVTLVGMLAADLSLHVGDYRAAERTFQLLTQAAGRAGRSSLPGEVVIQSYNPEHYAITYAAKQDYEGFYQEEITYRDLMMYPPVGHMLAVLILTPEEQQGQEMAISLTDEVKQKLTGKRIQVIGPAPASIGKINDVYRKIFYIKSNDYALLVLAKDVMERYILLKQWNTDFVQFDFDPMSGY